MSTARECSSNECKGGETCHPDSNSGKIGYCRPGEPPLSLPKMERSMPRPRPKMERSKGRPLMPQTDLRRRGVSIAERKNKKEFKLEGFPLAALIILILAFVAYFVLAYMKGLPPFTPKFGGSFGSYY